MRDININQRVPINVYPVYIPNKQDPSDRDLLIGEKFKIPTFALRLIDFFFTDKDKDFIVDLKKEAFAGENLDKDYLADAFHRGIISKVDAQSNQYKLNDFYGMLDVFCVSETEKYHTLSRELRRQLDDWYFNEYKDGLDSDLTKRPTADKVLTLDEMLQFIDGLEEPLYWAFCDCKCLSGDCGLPSHTCINYAPGINSFAARGISEVITKEEAKEVIIKADKAGLVHTVSDHGICNCCDDCCYLFRSQVERGSVGFWPQSDHIIEFDSDKCIACGKCQTRCHFNVFEKIGKGKEAHMKLDRSKCIGCGLCQQTCPTKALAIGSRTDEQMQIAGKRNKNAMF